MVLPEIVGRDAFAALIIRTDYADETAWQMIVAEVSQPSGAGGEYEARVHLVDDPVWAGSTPAAVRAAVRQDDQLSVVFVADRTTMQSAQHPLLALNISDEDKDLDPMYYQELIDSPPAQEFRTTPGAVHDVHANLSLANLDFDGFAEAALADSEGILRPL
ncbi:hypothetical protein GCM10011583_72590 [Streptomyces camponoticapitis]|uniref:DUF6924 domain-containing protein n=1 Tax=Streptomyces camponoticapitis TaxID=1616125 RepID=A0ABQ2F088_9ACTN|nr:hypothetical protein [Streptomyces camponoticapitis]GGK30147.1 hypothetical protein GCM10011583_72590 [Streptomyces camponoticapitis]